MREIDPKIPFKFHDFSVIFYCGMTRNQEQNTNLVIFFDNIYSSELL